MGQSQLGQILMGRLIHHGFKNTTEVKQADTTMIGQLLQAHIFVEIQKKKIPGLFYG
jgi:hypothetical protein